VSQAVSPPKRSLSTIVRAEAGRAVRSGQSLARWQARSTIPETLVFNASLVNGARTVMNRWREEVRARP
jgi:hypothetical protein